MPTAGLPPTVVFTDQVSWGSLTPATIAVNCWVPPARTVGADGEMEIVGALGGGEELGVPTTPAQLPVRMLRTKTKIEIATRRKIAPEVFDLIWNGLISAQTVRVRGGAELTKQDCCY